MESSILNITTCEDEDDLILAIQNYFLSQEEMRIAGWPEEVVEIWPLARQLSRIAIYMAFYFTLPFSIFGQLILYFFFIFFFFFLSFTNQVEDKFI